MTQPQQQDDDGPNEVVLEQTSRAIRDAIRETGDSNNLYDALSRHLDVITNCPITVTDAHGIALQSIEDTGSDDPDSPAWDRYEADDEGVLNHALYHRGRPGECGPNCPAFSTT